MRSVGPAHRETIDLVYGTLQSMMRKTTGQVGFALITGAEAIRDVCAKRGVPGDVEGTILDTLYAFANAVKDESATDYRAFGGGHS